MSNNSKECEHDWRFSGDIKYCIKCKKGETNYDIKSMTLHFPKEELKSYTLTEFEHDYYNVMQQLRDALICCQTIEEKIKIRKAEFPSWNDKFCTLITHQGKISALYHSFARNK